MKQSMKIGTCVLFLLAQWSLADTVHRIAGTGSNVSGGGAYIAWTDPDNIATPGSPYAICTLTPWARSDYLQGTNFGFTIPENAVIQGIQVYIRRQGSIALGYGVNDVVVSLIKGGVGGGANKAIAADWAKEMYTATYGGTADLWAKTWTPDDINDSTFGVALSAESNSPWYNLTTSVDTIGITITYDISVPVQLSSVASALPTEFSLSPNYPNPFNPSTTIKYELPKASTVSLIVHDILGHEVAVLVNEKRDAGIHEVTFDAAGIASGMYFYRLQAGSFIETKKLLLLR